MMYLPNMNEQPQKYHQSREEWDWNVEESVLYNVSLIRPKPGDLSGLVPEGQVAYFRCNQGGKGSIGR